MYCSKLFVRGNSFGKANGSGLGLWHARETVRAWGGEIEIRSEEGKGTEVDVVLPKALPPSHLISILAIACHSTILVLDDDPNVHEMWEGIVQGSFCGERTSRAPALSQSGRASILEKTAGPARGRLFALVRL